MDLLLNEYTCGVKENATVCCTAGKNWVNRILLHALNIRTSLVTTSFENFESAICGWKYNRILVL